jgi:hypothetical protein
MKIDIRNDKVIYVTIGDYEYYIDDSTDEQIMEIRHTPEKYAHCRLHWSPFGATIPQ